MKVTKYSGEVVPFDANSLRHSLTRSGATDEEVDKVYEDIKTHLYDGITTRELYEWAYAALKKQRNSYAARYSLKKALRDLGPEGFYFEKWISRLFAADGFETITGQTVQGHAVTHEIDVVAVKEDVMYAIECKFRNDVDAKISVTTPMYFMSRLKDISDISYDFFEGKRNFTGGCLVTNAYLTTDSISFGEYYRLNMLSWNYPVKNSLKLQVDNNGLYPITCLSTLKQKEKTDLLKLQCILVQDLVNHPSFLDHIDIEQHKKKHVVLEATELINSPLYVDR
ncbi:ATP cone domain-containing protein [Sphingobacterium wenxiniae]|uniref:Restriction endonuclease n=1 Tax=Sphingobacterium wenxiniae TaxID=683125 RepID=A0A1I6QLP1_9SPHI|nr:ATP cone domain-containing protein [Sphingobacterium wenxiniae]SFS53359.1 Restriction endonuclease [Sphingobacterium wenxiniae]